MYIPTGTETSIRKPTAAGNRDRATAGSQQIRQAPGIRAPGTRATYHNPAPGPLTIRFQVMYPLQTGHRTTGAISTSRAQAEAVDRPGQIPRAATPGLQAALPEATAEEAQEAAAEGEEEGRI